MSPKTLFYGFPDNLLQSTTCEDVAKHLGISAGAIYVARKRVMARLQEVVQEISEI